MVGHEVEKRRVNDDSRENVGNERMKNVKRIRIGEGKSLVAWWESENDDVTKKRREREKKGGERKSTTVEKEEGKEGNERGREESRQ